MCMYFFYNFLSLFLFFCLSRLLCVRCSYQFTTVSFKLYYLINLTVSFLRQIMDDSNQASTSGDRYLKCFVCHEHLSVAPIMIAPDGKRSKCGRCGFIFTDITIRNYPYEALMKLKAPRLPCMSCNEDVLWGNVEAHELFCQGQLIVCPMKTCNETIERNSIEHHFRNFHLYYIVFNNEVVCDAGIRLTGPPGFDNYLIKVNGVPEPFLYYGDRNDTHFLFSIYSFGSNSKRMEYKVHISSMCGKHVFSIKHQKIIPFNKYEHCIKCLRYSCTSKFHKYSQCHERNTEKIRNSMTTKISLKCLKDLFVTDFIKYRVCIVDSRSTNAVKSEKKPNSNLSI